MSLAAPQSPCQMLLLNLVLLRLVVTTVPAVQLCPVHACLTRNLWQCIASCAPCAADMCPAGNKDAEAVPGGACRCKAGFSASGVGPALTCTGAHVCLILPALFVFCVTTIPSRHALEACTEKHSI
jgi:hypothetical protein